MSPEEEEMLLFPSFVGFPEHFAADDTTPGSGKLIFHLLIS
jgi:hypothetical protein